MDSLTQAPKSTSSSTTNFTKKVVVVASVFSLLFILYTIVRMAFQVLLVLFAAVLFGILLNGLSNWLCRKTKLRYSWALAAICLLLATTVVGAFILLGPSLSEQTSQLQQDLPTVWKSLQTKIQGMPYGEQLLKQIPPPQKALQGQGSVLKNAFSFFSSTFGLLANMVIIIVIGIYLASSPQETANGLVRLVPKPKRQRAREVVHVLRFTLWGWLKGTLLAMAVIGTCTAIGLAIIGVPLALLLGVFAGLMEFVPNIGPIIAGVPAVLLAFVESPNKALLVIIFFAVIQSLEGYVLTPLVQKKIIDLPPILTLVGQLILSLMAGAWGMLLAVPMVAAIMVLVKMLYIEDVLGDYDVEVKGEEEAIEKAQHMSLPASEENKGNS